MRRSLLLLGSLLAPTLSWAQDLEPRAFSAAPVGLNIAALGYGYNTGDLLFGQEIPIENASAKLNTITSLYVRTIDFFGASAKLGATVPFAWGTYRGQMNGIDTSTTRAGFADPKVLLTVSFVGAPALAPREYSRFREGTVAGASLMVSIPVGQYDPSKLVNLGTNRWAFRPRIGASHATGKWTFELFADVWLFTTNPEQLGFTVEQDPIWAVQGHVIYSFRPGLWLGLDAGFGEGGNTTVDGVQTNNQQENTLLGGTLAVPVSRRGAFKLVYSTGVSTRVGADFDTFQVFYQYRWGAGL
jgi:hypothetical protein